MSRTAEGAGRDRDYCTEGMPERRWRVIGRGRGLFAIEVDDGGGFRAATTAEVDAARRQRELFEAAEYRCSASTRPKVRATSTSVERLRLPGGVDGRAVRGRVAGDWPAAEVGVVGVSVAGSGGPRGARLCGVRRRRPVAGLRHAGYRRRRPQGRGGH